MNLKNSFYFENCLICPPSKQYKQKKYPLTGKKNKNAISEMIAFLIEELKLPKNALVNCKNITNGSVGDSLSKSPYKNSFFRRLFNGGYRNRTHQFFFLPSVKTKNGLCQVFGGLHRKGFYKAGKTKYDVYIFGDDVHSTIVHHIFAKHVLAQLGVAAGNFFTVSINDPKIHCSQGDIKINQIISESTIDPSLVLEKDRLDNELPFLARYAMEDVSSPSFKELRPKQIRHYREQLFEMIPEYDMSESWFPFLSICQLHTVPERQWPAIFKKILDYGHIGNHNIYVTKECKEQYLYSPKEFIKVILDFGTITTNLGVMITRVSFVVLKGNTQKKSGYFQLSISHLERILKAKKMTKAPKNSELWFALMEQKKALGSVMKILKPLLPKVKVFTCHFDFEKTALFRFSGQKSFEFFKPLLDSLVDVAELFVVNKQGPYIVNKSLRGYCDFEHLWEAVVEWDCSVSGHEMVEARKQHKALFRELFRREIDLKQVKSRLLKLEPVLKSLVLGFSLIEFQTRLFIKFSDDLDLVKWKELRQTLNSIDSFLKLAP